MATDLYTQCAPLFAFANDVSVWGGTLLGLAISGVLSKALNFFNYYPPRRIKYRNLNGREERKDNFEYLYLFKGSYYTLEQRDFLRKEQLKKLKGI